MTAPTPPKPRSRGRVLPLSIAAGLVLAVAALGSGYLVGMNGSSAGGTASDGSSDATQRPEPEVSAPSVALPEVVAPPVGQVPADCSGIYSTDWSAAMGGFVLNPDWVEQVGGEARLGSADAALTATLLAAEPLHCVWGNDVGGTDQGVVTNVAGLTAEQQAAAIAQMQTLGFSCYEELGGTRCVSETTDDSGAWGESHFLRENVWVATRWINLSPDGYTHDIVNTLWP